MKTMAVYVGSLMAVLTTIHGWASAAAQPADKPVATAPTGQSQATEPEQFAQLRWDFSQKGREIDLTQYKRTFNDDFETMDIVKDNSAPGPGAVWFSPGHGAFRKNAPLRADGPFKLVDDGVRLRVEKVGKRWLGACMTTVNTKGEGFAQQYGYFEMTAEYNYPPPGRKGSRIWGAFWLKSQGDYFNHGTTTRTEIDINEFYGDDGYHVTGHLWPAAHLSPDATVTKHIFCSGYKSKVAPHLFKNLKVDGVVKGFHCYGGEITPQRVIMYFDRKEQARFPTMEEWKTPLYMLVDLVITKPEEEAVFPMDLTVKNISAYQPRKPYKGQ
jgi:beta-glucanase (GH16 family)